MANMNSSHTSADIGREWGWKPAKTEDDWNASFLDEAKSVLTELAAAEK